MMIKITLMYGWITCNSGLSHPFLGMGPGPFELGKIASFYLKLGKNTKFYASNFLSSD